MNLLPTFCAIILGATIGVTFNHKSKLANQHKNTSTSQTLPPINIYANLQTPVDSQTTTPIDNQPIFLPTSQNIPKQLSKDLAIVLKQQSILQRQLAEQSKELQNLTFRVDSHSNRFVPLRKESDTSDTLQNIEPSNLTPLLPPK